jgi:hypothetical protein
MAPLRGDKDVPHAEIGFERHAIACRTAVTPHQGDKLIAEKRL